MSLRRNWRRASPALRLCDVIRPEPVQAADPVLSPRCRLAASPPNNPRRHVRWCRAEFQAGIPCRLLWRRQRLGRTAIVPVADGRCSRPRATRYTSTRRKDIDAGITLVVVDTLTMQLELARDGYSKALAGSGPSRWASG